MRYLRTIKDSTKQNYIKNGDMKELKMESLQYKTDEVRKKQENSLNKMTDEKIPK
jgi:hypothetical protein